MQQQRKKKPRGGLPAASVARRPIGAALLLLLVFQAGGWFFAWHGQWRAARAEAATALEYAYTRFDTLHVAAAELPRLRVPGKHEVRVRGRLYDIKKESARGDSVELIVYHDREEERMLDGLAQIMGGAVCASEQSAPSSSESELARWSRWLGAVYLPAADPVWPMWPRAVAAPRIFLVRQLRQQAVMAVLEKPG